MKRLLFIFMILTIAASAVSAQVSYNLEFLNQLDLSPAEIGQIQEIQNRVGRDNQANWFLARFGASLYYL